MSYIVNYITAMKREDNPENFTAIFLLDESGRRVVGATVEVMPDGPDANIALEKYETEKREAGL